MKNTLLLLALCLCIWQGAHSQFVNGIGDDRNQRGVSVQHTPITDNGYVIAGAVANVAPLGVSDANVTKTDDLGNVLWSNAIGGPGFDYFNSIREVSFVDNVRYVATGYSTSFSTGLQDLYLVGMDATGVPVFSTIFGGSLQDQGYCIQPVNNSVQGYIMVGETSSFSSSSDIFVIKTDVNGLPLNQVVVGTLENDYGYWIEETSNGDFLIAGTTGYDCSGGSNEYNLYVLRLTSNLALRWSIVLEGEISAPETAYCVRENLYDNSIIVTGETNAWGGSTESFLLNLSAAGGFNWMMVYGGQQIESGQNVLVTTDLSGNPEYIVSGYSDNASIAGDFNAMLYKTDLSGGLLWAQLYGADNDEYAYEVDETPGAVEYVLTGSTLSFTNGMTDILHIETDNNGKSGSTCELEPDLIVREVKPCITEDATVVRVDGYRPVESEYVALEYKPVPCSADAALETSKETSSFDLRKKLPNTVKLGPNPTDANINLTFDETYNESALSVVNDKGSVVLTTTLTGHEATVNLQALPHGLYIIRIKQPDGTITSTRVLKQ